MGLAIAIDVPTKVPTFCGCRGSIVMHLNILYDTLQGFIQPMLRINPNEY